MLESKRDAVLQEDLEYIANGNIPLDELKNKTIFVTGATGLIGSQIVKALLCCNRLKDANIKIMALVRSESKVKDAYGELVDAPNLHFVYGDVTNKVEVEDDIDYIIHGASVTASKFFVDHPVETIQISHRGVENMLELAKEKNVKGMVYMSSMEAFGITDPSLDRVTEKDLGYIDIHNVRSCYSEGKRMCECMCACYAAEYGVPVKIARLAQTFGAGILYSENRVFAQFAKSAMNKTDIVMHTEGKSVGNYVYTRDAVMAMLTLLVKGNNGEAYTIANEESNITIGNMAKMVANEIAGGEIKVVFDIPEDAKTYGYAPDVQMRLSSQKMQGLGWRPTIGLKDSYLRMMESMKNTM